ncbi:translocation/assembly module TamB [Fulvivirga sp. M361]|uniref:translocation/assembly module TamB domain-containing protein n=1 Tax=Fulvivirga sp. M361 TaxID=2594266 RepID=UPI0016280F2F|nr:translocation/assembly module TamB [Fulvivirga sp. M361]
MSPRARAILKSTLKVFAWALGIPLALLVVAIILIRVPFIQDKIIDQTEHYLENTLDAEVNIGGVFLNFPKTIEISDFYLEDQKEDTLLYFRSLQVDADMWALTDNTVEINDLKLIGAIGRVHRKVNRSDFNYQFIIDAFAPADTTIQERSDAKPWTFNLEAIQVGPFDFRMDDAQNTSSLYAYWSDLQLDFNAFDLDQSRMDIKRIDLSSANIGYKMQTVPSGQSRQAGTSEGFDLKVGEVRINDSDVHFTDLHQNVNASIHELAILVEEMNLSESLIALEQLDLIESKVSYQSFQGADSTKEKTSDTQNPWELSLRELNFIKNDVRIDLDSSKTNSTYFDPNHLHVQQLTADIHNTSYSQNEIHSEIAKLSFITDEQSMKLEGMFHMDSTQLSVANAAIHMNQTSILSDFQAKYSSQSDLANASTELDLHLGSSVIYTEDLSYFLADPEAMVFPDKLMLEARIDGRLDALNIKTLAATTSATTLDLSGHLYDLLNPDSLTYSLESFELNTTQQDILNHLPDSLLPLPIRLPKDLRVVAKGNGSLNHFNGNLDLSSGYGHLSLRADTLAIHNNIPVYAISLNSGHFDVGNLFHRDDLLDSLGLDLELKGKGIDPKTMDITAKGVITNILFNQHTYDSLLIDATWMRSILNGTLAISDNHLDLILKGEVETGTDYYRNNIQLNLEKADLEAMNFSKMPLTIKSKFKADFETKDFRRFNGDLALRKFQADNDIDIYRVDSLLVASIDQEGSTEISINSDIMEGEFKGNIDLFTVSTAVMQHINQYYDLTEIPNENVPETNFQFDFDLKNTDLITEIIFPDLKEFNPGHFKAVFNSTQDQLDVSLTIHHLLYKNIGIDSFSLTSTSLNKTLQSNFDIERISSSNAELNKLSLNTTMSNNTLATALIIRDSLEHRKYLIRGLFESIDSTYSFVLNNDSLILAYDRWQVEQERPFIVNDHEHSERTSLRLSHKEQSITIATRAPDSLLVIGFDHFQLATLGKALQKDKDLINGQLDGDIRLLFANQGPGILADITIEKLVVLDKKWGDFKLTTEKHKENRYQADLKLLSAKNDITLQAKYELSDLDNLSAELVINKFQLATLSPIVKSDVKNLSGNLSGTISLSGGFDQPAINGSVELTKVSFNPTVLNNTLMIDNEVISFNDSKIRFDRFRLMDQLNNSAVINGNVEMVDPAFYRLDLKISTNDFLILNTTRKDNSLFYGTVKTDGEAIITGSSARPNVRLNMKLTDDSELTYLVPETQYTSLNSENVVQFINTSDEEIDQPKDILRDSLNFQGMNLTTTLEIDKSATFNIIIDPITEDRLTVQGAATLNLAIDRQGDIELSGRYTVKKGAYNFSFYKLLKREFSIEKGSSITWSGDPYEARLDIRAYNRVEAPPIDLMINQISNATNTDLDRYKQRLPFLVYLDIEGELMKPQIRFELDMPQDKRNAFGGSIYSRITDLNSRESDLNKQVFALLLLQRFISEDPLKSEGGYDIEDKARRSVSRILSDQLNRLTDNINGINLNLDLQSYQDYSQGTAQSTTQLELGVSKTLFNDQLEVKVSGNVNLEGEQQQNFSDYVGDLALEYKLTDDGRLRITGFRRSDFDVLSGEIIETGAGIIYVRDYNTFKELFKSSDEE